MLLKNTLMFYFFFFLSLSCRSFSLPVGGLSRFLPSRVAGRGTNDVLVVLSLGPDANGRTPPLCIIAFLDAPITSNSLGWTEGLPDAIAAAPGTPLPPAATIAAAVTSRRTGGGGARGPATAA